MRAVAAPVPGATRALVTGAAGMLGTALVAELRGVGQAVIGIGRGEADLRDQAATEAVFARYRPEIVYHLACRVRGVMGNAGTQGEAFLDNIRINTNVVEAARRCGARKIVAMGSAAIYGDAVPLPMREEDCWLGGPHGSEAGYAHAKRAMLAQLEMYQEQWGLAFVYCISTNLFGPHDRFDEGGGHVVPSLISKFHRAVVDGGEVAVWGSGTPTRDLLYVGDAARALRVMGEAGSGAINLASGVTVTIGGLVALLAEVAGYRGEIVWDRGKPDGQHRRAYDLTRLRALGVKAGRPLREGLAETYGWFAANLGEVRR